MNIEHIFNTYFNGETNFVTPNIYDYDYKSFGDKILLIEKSKGKGFISNQTIFGCTTLIYIPKKNSVQRIDLSQCFYSKQEINTYIKNINSNTINNATVYGEIKTIR